MRQLSDKGVLTLLSTIGNNLDLDGLNPEMVQTAIRTPVQTGRAFSAWVNAGCPMMELTETGIIRFSVTSDGTTGEAWITRLEGAGKSVSGYAKSILRSADFVPSPAGTVYVVAVLKGSLFEDNARTTVNIRAEANGRDLKKPNAEVACLIRAQFTDDEIKAMGLRWIVTMHEPIKDSDGDPCLLGACRSDYSFHLDAHYGKSGFRWAREYGFAFLQV